MDERIAVRCRNEKEWEEVKEKRDKGGTVSFQEASNGEGHGCPCLCLEDHCYSNISFLEGQGYTIISAKEYLRKDDTAEGAAAYGRFMGGDQWGTEHLSDTRCINILNETLRNWTKEEKMNKNIVAAFPKTEEAVLVEEQLGDQIGPGFIAGLTVKDHAAEILAEAKRLKKIQEARKC